MNRTDGRQERREVLVAPGAPHPGAQWLRGRRDLIENGTHVGDLHDGNGNT